MYEKEKQRATHLMILLCYTILTVGLIGESLLLGWDTGAVVLLLFGLVASWAVHITGKIPEQGRLWLSFVLSMLSFFFYGIHETSIYDLAPMMIVIIIMFSATEVYSIVRLCVLTYFLTMGYDFVFVLGGSVELTSLSVTRLLLHLALVYMAGQMAKFVIRRRSAEEKYADGRIAELEETNRRTEDFLTNVSHELRTPINAVTGITEIMLKNEENSEKRKDILSIQKAGSRLFSQIEDILDYTEIDTARITVSEDIYRMSSLVNDIITGNHLTERENAPELIIDVDAGMPSAFLGDGRKIKKIIVHLIDNAVKFTKKGGIYVRIYALHKSYGVNLCIRVSDTGIGIAEEELEKIKERFYQSNGGRNRRAGGLGLGLPIVYGLVSAMEGFIQIESTVGEGTTVSVSIPQKVSDEAPGMVVANRGDLCLACFLRPEKYEVPQVRDYYDEIISHMVCGLEIPLHRVFSVDELEKLAEMYQLTHLFIGGEEYEESQAYFEGMDKSIEIVVVADEGFVLPQNSRLRILRKPFNSMAVVNLLNAKASECGDMFRKKRMLCPGVRVLVVDDEPMNLMVAEGILKEYQMSVTTAESGRKAISLCESENFDLILLDHMMPEMDGVETLKRLRKIYTETGRVLTVIAFTANAVSGAREMFLQEGFDEFISKPIETQELERVLKKVLPKASIAFVEEQDRENAKTQDIKEQTASQELRLESAGIHTSSGLQYCCGDKAFYVELLTKFGKDAGRKEKEIDNFFQQGDYGNYAILVHALKSTAKMVGADALSENAKKMEAAAKNYDSDYIREHHEALLAEYQQVAASISDVFDLGVSAPLQIPQEAGAEISKEDLLGRLAELKEGLDTFEADRTESLIAELSGTAYRGVSVGELLYAVRQDVEDFEFASASEKVEDFIIKVEGGEVG